MSASQRRNKALKRLLGGKASTSDKAHNKAAAQGKARTPNKAKAKGVGGENESGDGLFGEDMTRDALMRLVTKEVIENPAEQEVLFLCSVNKGRAQKYQLLVGAAGGERSRYLCVAFESGAKANFTGGGGEVDGKGGGEVFVVMYYFTISMSQSSESPVTLKNDVYINDLASVEYGAGTEFTLTFDQTPPIHLSATSPTNRDEIVWNILTPETRSVDLHGLSLTATTQNFLQRNEMLNRYLASIMEQDKSKSSRPKQAMLMDPFMAFGTDEEVDSLLNGFKWPEQQVEDIDRKLNDDLKRLERETVEVLLSWENKHADGTSSPLPNNNNSKSNISSQLDNSKAACVQTNDGYLSTLQLIDMLDELSAELELMEQWLASKGSALKFMQDDMLEIEAENNRLERQSKNYLKLNGLLKPLVKDLGLTADTERMLKNPGKQLDLLPGESNASDRVEELVFAAKHLKRAIALLQGNEEAIPPPPTPTGPPGLKSNAASASTSASTPTTQGPGAAGKAEDNKGRPQQGQGPAPVEKLRSVPRRLMAMESLKSQLRLLEGIRDEFVSKCCNYMCGYFGRVIKPDSLPGEGKKEDGRRPSIAGGQALVQFQRVFHGKLMDYDPLLEVLCALLKDDKAGGGQRVDEMLRAYREAGQSTLYRPLLKYYFQQLHFRTSSGKDPHATLNSLPRANILDTSLPASTDGQGDGMAPSLAIGQALAQLLPVLKREQMFVTTIFRLSPEENEEDFRKLEGVLSVEFDKFREKLAEKAEAAEESDPFEGLAILSVIKQTLDPGNTTSIATDDRFMSEMLIALQISLATKFNKFIQDQDNWIQHFSADIKRAGVLAPFAKFPSFVDRLQQAVRGRPIDIANAALQKLSSSLLSWLEKVSQQNPKYSDVVRLENYNFFAVTMGLRQQRLAGTALVPYIEQANTHFEGCSQRYLSWLIEYEFPSLTAFFQRLEDLISKVGPGDVAIHVARINLTKVMEQNGRKVISEGLQNSFKRLRKHISDDSNLFSPLWDRLTSMLFLSFSRYEEICMTCYEYRLEPSAATIKQLAQECRSTK